LLLGATYGEKDAHQLAVSVPSIQMHVASSDIVLYTQGQLRSQYGARTFEQNLLLELHSGRV